MLPLIFLAALFQQCFSWFHLEWAEGRRNRFRRPLILKTPVGYNSLMYDGKVLGTKGLMNETLPYHVGVEGVWAGGGVVLFVHPPSHTFLGV